MKFIRHLGKPGPQVTKPIGQLLAWMILLTLGYNYFDRVAYFHDELINTWKGSVGLVFDYAVRPLFYGWNSLCVHYLGNDLRSLSFSGLFFSLLSGWIIYLHAQKNFGIIIGLAATVLYAWTGYVYLFGITGMPHILPVFFMLAAFLIEHCTQWKHWRLKILAVSLLVFCSLFSHPTAIALVVSFYIMLFIRLSISFFRHEESKFLVLKEALVWLAAGFLWLLLIDLGYRFFTADSFFTTWMKTLSRTTAPEYIRYAKNNFYYFGILWLKLRHISGLMVGLLAAALILSRGQSFTFLQPEKIPGRDKQIKVACEFILFSLLSMLIISQAQWKFPRVMVTFLPFAAYSTLMIGVLGLTFIRQFRCLVALGVLGSCLFCAWPQFMADIDQVKKRQEPRGEIYSLPFTQLKRSRMSEVVYFGNPFNGRRLNMFVAAAGKKFTRAPRVTNLAEAQAELRNYSDQNEIGIAVSADSSSSSGQLMRAALNKAGYRCRIIYAAGKIEIWENYLLDSGSPIENFLVFNKPKCGVVSDRPFGKVIGENLQHHGIKVVLIHADASNQTNRHRIKANMTKSFLLPASHRDPNLLRLEDLLRKLDFHRELSGQLLLNHDERFDLWIL